MKKILIISLSNLYHDARVLTYIRKLKEMGYNVVAISLKENAADSFKEEKEFINYRIVKRYIGSSQKRYLFFYLKFFFISFILVTFLFIKYKFKVIHYNNSPNFIIFSCLVPKIFGSKLILDNHDLVPILMISKFDNKFFHRITKIEQNWSMKFSNQILCADHGQKDYLIESGIKIKKITPILNVPNTSIFKVNDVRTSNGLNINMVYHGTISYRLGQDLIIEAINKIKDNIPNLIFHLIGKGDTVQELKQLVKKYKIESYINIYDKFFPLEEIPKILLNMDIGILPQRNSLQTSTYGFPVKLFEYVIMNIPIIAPRYKAIQRYFSEDMLCFFEPENIEDMADKILFLYNNKKARNEYSINAKRFFEKYNYNTEMNKYEEIIKSLLN